MRQKYVISFSEDSSSLTIQEYAEADKEIFSLLCEEVYEATAVTEAVAAGKEALVTLLRTANFYPPGIYAEKIAESVIQLLNSDDIQSMELMFDDKEILHRQSKEKEAEALTEEETESVEIDDLLEEDLDKNMEEDNEDEISDSPSPKMS